MIWQVTMPVWVAAVFMVAFLLLFAAFVIIRVKFYYDHTMKTWDRERGQLLEVISLCEVERDGLNDALRAARDERATLKLQLAEATKPKERTPRTKKERIEP